MKQVIVYKRLSRERTGNQYGFDSQQADLDNWVNNNGAKVVAEYGEYFSGRGDYKNRPEFTKALEHCKRIGATLLVNKPDRLARDVESGAHILKNYDVVFANFPDADTLTKHILLTVAQAESDAISQRTKAGLAVAKKQGVKIGRASDKYTLKSPCKSISDVNKKDASKRTTTATAALKLALTLNPYYTYRQLAEILDGQGIPLPSGKAGNWKAAQVGRVLKREGLR